MKKFLLMIFICTLFLLNGCSPESLKMRSPSAETETDTMQTTMIDGKEFYLVKTESELVSIGNTYPLSGNYILDQDITLMKEWKPIGNESEPFTGVFDGNDYTINNLTVTKNYDDTGFFNASVGAVIKNLVIENANIDGNVAFAIVGYAVDTEITDCFINQSE